MHTTSYADAFIETAEDCPVDAAVAPPEKAPPTVARMQYAALIDAPDRFASDGLVFGVHAARAGMPEADSDGGRTVDCPFCPNPDFDQVAVFRDDLVVYVEDERYQGALKHSGMIVPVRHAETVFDLNEAEVAATFRMLARVKAWMDERVAPDGYTVGWNCGTTGGQEVFHAHLHVLPRFRAEPFAGRGLRSWLKSDANRW